MENAFAMAGDGDDDLVRMLRDSAAAFCRDGGIERARALRFQQPGLDREAWGRMAENGWLGVALSEADGGLGAGYGAAGALAEQLARAITPEPVTAVAILTALAVAACPASDARKRLLDGIVAGDIIAALAFQTEGGALDPSATELKLSGGKVSGVARHVFPALGVDGYVVAAQGGEGLTLAYVAADASGISVEPELRADGSHSGRVTFAATDAEILGAGGDIAAGLAHAMDVATIMTSAELFGLMEQALDNTLEYMRTRIQFNRPIGSFQALQHRCVALWIQKEMCRGAVADALKALDNGVSAQERRFAAGRAKSRAGDAGLMVCREAIFLHGAIGFTDEFDIGLFLRRAMTLYAWLGNPAQHRRVLAPMIESRGIGQEDAVQAKFDPVFVDPDRSDTEWNSFSDAEFRAGIRAFFEKFYPQELRFIGRRLGPDEVKSWQDVIARKGFTAPAWPVEHGGMGLSPAKQVIYIEERERVGAARSAEQGVNMLGPMLMHYGTQEQRDYYLPKILTGEHYWCQGYSEPNAGSDLASLKTEAVLDGDEYVINGSKIWTSGGHQADHMFLLARTSKEGRKQEGISFILLKLDTPGVTRRPIRNLSGHEEFAQIFFDDVRVHRSALVGEENAGWAVAKTLLGFERLGSGAPRRVQVPLNRLITVAKATGQWGEPEFRARYVPLFLDVVDQGTAYGRFCDIVKSGERPGPEISMLKIWAGETTQKLTEFLMECGGSAGAIRSKQMFDDEEINILDPFYQVFGATIASGTNDIQRNIIAQRVLNLPRG